MIPSLTLLPVKYEYGGSPCGRIIPHVQPGVKKEAPVTAEASLYFYIHLSYALIDRRFQIPGRQYQLDEGEGGGNRFCNGARGLSYEGHGDYL